LHAHRIGQPHGRHAGAERAVNAITGVGQHDLMRDPGRESGPDLIECDLRFGPEDYIIRNMGFLASRFIRRPIFQQIQTIGDRQTRRVIGDRKRHRGLTIVGLAKPPAILARHTHRVHALRIRPTKTAYRTGERYQTLWLTPGIVTVP